MSSLQSDGQLLEGQHLESEKKRSTQRAENEKRASVLSSALANLPGMVSFRDQHSLCRPREKKNREREKFPLCKARGRVRYRPLKRGQRWGRTLPSELGIHEKKNSGAQERKISSLQDERTCGEFSLNLT